MASQQISGQQQNDWVTHWLSAARFRVYEAAADGDQPLALELYEWNAEVSSAVLHDLAHIEVGLRNAYDSAFETHTSLARHWTLGGSQLFAPEYRTKKTWDPSQQRRVKKRVDINYKLRDSLERAIREAGGHRAASGKVIAQLMFGFWRYLTSGAHERTLWIPYLHHAFPTGTPRSYVDVRVGELHDLRNRVAHHEPLLSEDLSRKHKLLLELAELIEPNLATHIETTSRVSLLASARPV